MLSFEKRRAPLHFSFHLEQAQRQALNRGLIWLWCISLLAILFLACRYHAYLGAGMILTERLPWSFPQQLGLTLLQQLSLPIGWFAITRLTHRRWRACILLLSVLWSLGWVGIGYSIGVLELRGGASLTNSYINVILVMALIAFYPDGRLFYAFVTPLLLFQLSEHLFHSFAFVWLHLLAVSFVLVILEAGRRLLHDWFRLAVRNEVENLRLARRLEVQANMDELTRVANRRHFNRALNKAMALSRRHRLPLSVILSDVDYFKRYNDHYGHQAGDACLKEVAQQLQSSVRKDEDLVARYGGEEFVILLPGMTADEAGEVARRVREQLACLALEHVGSLVAPVVTLSQGVAEYQPGEGEDAFLQRADEALYAVKEAGRDGYRLAALPTSD